LSGFLKAGQCNPLDWLHKFRLVSVCGIPI
jgi:hypothetical protein